MFNTYLIVFLILLVLELVYIKVADKYSIVDNPNKRSSHSTVVIRGGGIIFSLSMLVWAGMMIFNGNGLVVIDYLPFLCGLVVIAAVSFVDDIHSLSGGMRLVAQFVTMGLLLWNTGIMHWSMWWIVALILFVGAANVINFMDGINGITVGYGLAVIVPLLLLNNRGEDTFVENSFLIVAALGLLVFSLFNFRPRGKAKCFAGDVGSIGIAFIMLFSLGKLIVYSDDISWIVLFLVYGIDGCMTIFHRVMLHENILESHRKHAYQLMANELGMNHVVVSSLYAGLQLVISLVAIYVIPDTVVARWGYLACVGIILTLAYILFVKKYYHLHEEYLKQQDLNGK